jgi:hypothetical protein
MNVGAADTHRANLDEHFPFSRLGHGSLLDAQIPNAV